MAKVPHCVSVYQYNCYLAASYGHGGKPRQFKKSMRKNGLRSGAGDVYMAYLQGEWNSERKAPKANPYPPGKRHDAFDRGNATADPMGDHHSGNW